MDNAKARLESLERVAGPDSTNKMLMADMDAVKDENLVLKNVNESLEGMNNRYKRELDAAIKAVQEARALEAAHAQARKDMKVCVERPCCLCVCIVVSVSRQTMCATCETLVCMQSAALYMMHVDMPCTDVFQSSMLLSVHLHACVSDL